jgi:protein-S-isoprenylcysteine O-methyltransferase Ste14
VNADSTDEARRPHPVVSVAPALAVTAVDAALLAWAMGSVHALLGHHRALVLLALWAAGGVALALLRPLRGHDAVSVERESPLVMLLLLLIPLATPPISALGERLALWNLPGGAPLRWTGVVLSGGGLALRIAAMAQLGPRFSPRVAMQREHALETHGLYGRIRHPGYAGAWLASFGAALAFGSALALPLVAAMGLLLWNRAGREESMLARHFGDAYQRYRARTGRFVPRLAPSRTPPA